MAKRDPNALTDPYAEPPPSEAPPSSIAPESSAPDSSAPDSSIDSSAPETPPPRRELPSSPLYSGAHGSLSGGAVALGPGGLPPGEEPSPEAVRKRSKRRGRRLRRALAWAFGVLGVVALLGAGGFLVYQRAFAKPKQPVFPLGNVRTLPETTLAVHRLNQKAVRTQYDYKPLDQALWSEMAGRVCGGDDLFSALLGSSRWDFSRRRVAHILAERHQAAKRLACGKVVAAHFDGARFDVELRDPAKDDPKPSGLEDDAPKKDAKKDDRALPTPRHRVSLFELDLAALPDGAADFIERRERSGLLATRCVSSSQRRWGECGANASAAARLEGTDLWVTGGLSDIEAFGRELSRTGKNEIEQRETFERVGALLEEFPTSSVGSHEVFDIGFVRRFGIHTESAGWEAAAFNVKLTDALRSYGAFWGYGDGISSTEGVALLVFEPASEADAIDLVLDLKEWRSAAKELFEGSAALDLSKEEELKKVDRDGIEARHKAGLRCLEDAELERDGKLVTMRLTFAPSETELEKIRDSIADTNERRQTAAKVIDQVLAGDKPDEDLLRDLGGRELVEQVKHPDSESVRERRGD